jgi:hypothetical protein
MTIYDTYGTSIYTAAKLAHIAADRLGLTFTERESDYRGIYYRADVPPYQIEVQPNVIPADDGQDDLYTPDHPQTQTLLLVTGVHRAPALDASLNRARPDQAGRRRNSLPSGSVSSADPSSSTAMSVAPSDTNRSISVCGSAPTVASRNRWLLRATFGVRG